MLPELRHLNLRANPITPEAAAAAKAELAVEREDVLLELPQPLSRLELEEDGWFGWLRPGWLGLVQSMYHGMSMLEWAQLTHRRGDVVAE